MSQQKCLDMDKIYEILQKSNRIRKNRLNCHWKELVNIFQQRILKAAGWFDWKIIKELGKTKCKIKKWKYEKDGKYYGKLTYTNVNGYLIPNITYKSGNQMEQLGKYGFLRRDYYLKNHRNSTYQVMLLQDTIGEHLLEVDKAAREREEVILKQLEEKNHCQIRRKIKMAWVRAANQHRAIAEEIILKELIYV